MTDRIPIKSKDEIQLMRKISRITSRVLDSLESFIVPGISTEDINDFVVAQIKEQGAKASPLNYKGFPKSVCTSVNDVVCHGIPSPTEILKAGDIINVDVTCNKDGYHGDSCRMYFVGGRSACSKEALALCDTTYAAMHAGISVVKPGAHIGDIGAAIDKFIRESGRNYGIVKEYTGHGVGKAFHEAPTVLHFAHKAPTAVMKPGMTFTIEPMINAGDWRTKLSKIDGWTVRSYDGSLSAQWEHTVLVTDSGVEILTVSE
jgi:methionyl aminopeptidase